MAVWIMSVQEPQSPACAPIVREPRSRVMLIAIEGCVGAGKTTIARGLAGYRKSELLLENFEANPFLQAFYEDPIGNAFETEFAFLLLHYHQLKGHAELASKSEVIADFHLGKDLIYADLNLKDEPARRLFDGLYELCLRKTPHLALLVFLSAPTELVVDRIRARSRDYELEIDPAYYATVNAAYEQFFEGYSGDKLRVSMEEWDFVKEPELYDRLALLIDTALQNK